MTTSKTAAVHEHRVATVACILLMIAMTPMTARAQNAASSQSVTAAQDAALANVDSLIARSRFREAANALDAWEREKASNATDAARASALLLRARMTSDADSARGLYLSLSLGYPSSPEAAVALLRLGQYAHAQNDNTAAAGYFRRITMDYPESPVRSEAVEWLTKAGGARGQQNAAAPPPRGNAATQKSGAPAATAAAGAFALQIAAFREPTSAAGVARKLVQQGFKARVVTVPGSTLSRVRVGTFVTARAAADEQRRLRSAGYEAVVVNDARVEKGS